MASLANPCLSASPLWRKRTGLPPICRPCLGPPSRYVAWALLERVERFINEGGALPAPEGPIRALKECAVILPLIDDEKLLRACVGEVRRCLREAMGVDYSRRSIAAWLGVAAVESGQDSL